MPSSPPERAAPKIVFDLDDTLYLERDFAQSGFDAVGRFMSERHGIAGFADLCATLFDGPHRTAIFDEALRQSDLGHAQGVGELIAIYRGHAPRISLCADAARYLTGKDGFALITDGPEAMQRAKIAALRLTPFLDQIIPTGQWGQGFGKPHPRAFEAVGAHAGPRTCVYVADNAAKDFVTPNRLGWLTVQILRPERVHPGTAPDRDHEAQVVIGSLDQLDAVIADRCGVRPR